MLNGEGEGEEEEGEKNGGDDDDGEAPPALAPTLPDAPPPSDGDSGTGLGALLITTEKSPQGSPHVQTSPSTVSAAECVPPAETCFKHR